MTETPKSASDIAPLKAEPNPALERFHAEMGAAEKANQPQILEHINDIENPSLTKKKITVNATIASTSTVFTIPKLFDAALKNETSTNSIKFSIAPSDPINIEIADISHKAKKKLIKEAIEAKFPAHTVFVNDEKEYRNLYQVRVRPPIFSLKMDSKQNKIIDDKGNEYKCLDLYIVSETQLALQPSTLIQIKGLPLPSPKTQKTTLLAYEISYPDDVNTFDSTKLNELKQEFEGLTVQERLDWVLNEFQSYSRIVGRRNIATAGFLAYYTPLYADFRGEYRNGWGNIAIIGDTTTAKSETIKRISALLKAGMIISAESASIVGLTGAAIQSEKGTWFIDWGFLPLNDRKLVGFDGMHKISKAAIATMCEAERDGKVTIAKAGKASTTARTRQIKIFNPLDEESRNFSTKSLGEFLYPVQAIRTVLDEISIARLDVLVTSDSRDVTPEQINSIEKPELNPKLELLSESLKWVWSNASQVEWATDAETTLLERATELQRQFFYKEIPLISPDTKWKLVRLSIALAGLTLSTSDFKTIQVTKEHVETIVNFLITEYKRIGLNVLSETEQHFKQMTPDEAKIIIENLAVQLINLKHPIENNVDDILKFIAVKNHFTKNELIAKFELTENNQVRPLIAILQTSGLISNKKGFYATAKLNEMFTVTNGFITLITLNSPKNEPPPQKKSAIQQKIDRDINFEAGKYDNYDKNESQLEDSDREGVHYQKINPYVESHACDRCKALLADYKQRISKEDQTRLKLSSPSLYLCKACFDAAKAQAEKLGDKLIEDPQDEPVSDGEGF
jgi:hypothetical protein